MNFLSGNSWNALRHITWRGALHSCNYACDYCPFARKKSSPAELRKDQAALAAFLDFLIRKPFPQPLSILLAPAGEGLIHPHYRKALAALSRMEQVAQVSCQTNLGFSAEALLEDFMQLGADFSRLSLWASFHPTMTRPEEFAAKVNLLSRFMPLSVGVVGEPTNFSSISSLKALLPETASFWINAKDGLKRPYSQEEKAAFLELDPTFTLELQSGRGPLSACGGGRQSIFVEADGSFSFCLRSGISGGNLYSGKKKEKADEIHSLHCKGRCDCFLAYSLRKDLPLLFHYGPYPELRIQGSRKIKALFFDLDGTLTDSDGKLRPSLMDGLRKLAATYRIYAATALPISYARAKCADVWDLFSGAAFSYGAHVADFSLGFSRLLPLPIRMAETLQSYMEDGKIYKQILHEEPEAVPHGCRLIRDGGVLSFIAAEADKLSGVELICHWNHWQRDEVLVMGDGWADIPMLAAFPFSVAPPEASPGALEAARFHMDAEELFSLLGSIR